jgi:hypothetical protein
MRRFRSPVSFFLSQQRVHRNDWNGDSMFQCFFVSVCRSRKAGGNSGHVNICRSSTDARAPSLTCAQKHPRHSPILFVGKNASWIMHIRAKRSLTRARSTGTCSIVTRQRNGGYPIAGIKQYLGRRSECWPMGWRGRCRC